jgi:hypothetical protein
MKISNDLKRVRRKLKLFEKEGLNELLFDFIDLLGKEGEMKYPTMASSDKRNLIDTLEARYKTEERELTPPDPKQSKLFE